MKPAKAIEILHDINQAQTSSKTADSIIAIRLGAEALQRILHTRGFNHDWAIMPLPSESRD